MENRCSSVLKYAGVSYTDKNDQEIKLSTKLNRMCSNPAFTNNYIRKRPPIDFIEEIRTWKKERDNQEQMIGALLSKNVTVLGGDSKLSKRMKKIFPGWHFISVEDDTIGPMMRRI